MAAYIYTLPDTIHYKIKDQHGVLRFHIMVDIVSETVEIARHGQTRDALVFPLHCLEEISTIFSDTEKIVKLKPEKNE